MDEFAAYAANTILLTPAHKRPNNPSDPKMPFFIGIETNCCVYYDWNLSTGFRTLSNQSYTMYKNVRTL